MDTSINSLSRIGGVLFNKFLASQGHPPIILPSLQSPHGSAVQPLFIRPSLERLLQFGGSIFPRGDVRLCLLVNKNVPSDTTTLTVLYVERTIRDSEMYQLLRELTPLRNLKIISSQSLPSSYTLSESDAKNIDVIAVPAFELEALIQDDDTMVKRVTDRWRARVASSRVIFMPLSRVPGRPLAGIFHVDPSVYPQSVREQIEDEPLFQEITSELKESEDTSSLATSLVTRHGIITFKRKITDTPAATRVTLRSVHGTQPKTTLAHLWPHDDSSPGIFERVVLSPVSGLEELSKRPTGLYVSRTDALTNVSWARDATVVWTAGLSTWRKLCSRGVWVHGSSESIGERELLCETEIVPLERWIKIAHQGAPATEGMPCVATYELKKIGAFPELSEITHFYWRSASLFEAAISTTPAIRGAWHACGAGNSYDEIVKHIPKERVAVFLTHRDWKKESIYETPAKAA